MKFEEAYCLPIGKYVEKKGSFSFLSWVYAVRFLRENFPKSTWIVHEYENTPLFPAPTGYMVKVSVIHCERQYPQWHPVLDFKNDPIPKPSSFQTNTAIQRCLTKAIGIATGIGLGLYAGEDLPTENAHSFITEEQRKTIQKLTAETGSDADKLLEFAGAVDFDTIPSSKFNQLKNMLEGKLKDDNNKR